MFKVVVVVVDVVIAVIVEEVVEVVVDVVIVVVVDREALVYEWERLGPRRKASHATASKRHRHI